MENFESPPVSKERSAQTEDFEIEFQDVGEIIPRDPEFEKVIGRFNQVIDNFPGLKTKFRTEILDLISENLRLAKLNIPFVGVQIIYEMLIETGVWDTSKLEFQTDLSTQGIVFIASAATIFLYKSWAVMLKDMTGVIKNFIDKYEKSHSAIVQ